MRPPHRAILQRAVLATAFMILAALDPGRAFAGSHIVTSVEGSVATVLLSNPPFNWLNGDNVSSLLREFRRLRRSDAVKVVVLAGASEHPITGTDPLTILSWSNVDEWKTYRQPFIRLLDYIESSPKPVIMAIHDGATVGGALELALATHIRVASGSRARPSSSPARKRPSR